MNEISIIQNAIRNGTSLPPELLKKYRVMTLFDNYAVHKRSSNIKLLDALSAEDCGRLIFLQLDFHKKHSGKENYYTLVSFMYHRHYLPTKDQEFIPDLFQYLLTKDPDIWKHFLKIIGRQDFPTSHDFLNFIIKNVRHVDIISTKEFKKLYLKKSSLCVNFPMHIENYHYEELSTLGFEILERELYKNVNNIPHIDKLLAGMLLGHGNITNNYTHLWDINPIEFPCYYKIRDFHAMHSVTGICYQDFKASNVDVLQEYTILS